MKLHLGCGQKYLKGYINIDYPMIKHTVQSKMIADIEADILKLKYKKSTVAEIRLHHLFEHFPRAVACALVGSWNSWLIKEGILRIEVPDFDRSVKSYFSPFASKKKKGVVLRHIFGSQEAPWAIHFNGWTENQLKDLMGIAGYKITEVKRNSYKGTYNIEVFAVKITDLSNNDYLKDSKAFLSNYLVDNSETEKIMLKVWMNELREQIAKSWGN